MSANCVAAGCGFARRKGHDDSNDRSPHLVDGQPGQLDDDQRRSHRRADARQPANGSQLHHEAGEVGGRHEDHLPLRRRSVVRYPATSLQDVVQRLVQRDVHEERRLRLPVQHDDVQLPLRDHRERRVHHLHHRRQDLLRSGASVLRLHRRLPEGRLRVLRLLQRHARLLLLLLIHFAAEESRLVPPEAAFVLRLQIRVISWCIRHL